MAEITSDRTRPPWPFCGDSTIFVVFRRRPDAAASPARHPPPRCPCTPVPSAVDGTWVSCEGLARARGEGEVVSPDALESDGGLASSRRASKLPRPRRDGAVRVPGPDRRRTAPRARRLCHVRRNGGPRCAPGRRPWARPLRVILTTGRDKPQP